ncbi:hypothetical protein IMZ48_27530 [Candidatus Bathyarchaeota archaeon]|nr:hypothetical protein [Candidatus Bathyarchaeota archaeon]
MTATPIAAEQDKHIVKRQLDDENKEGKIGFISNRHGQMVRNKTTMVSEWDNKFIVSPATALLPALLHLGPKRANHPRAQKSQPKPSKAKKTEMKSVRIPENELMDKIFQCFTQFQYWSLKSLRAQLQQPEAYLRQTLEKIAILNKSGRFANNWSLKPENMSANQRNAGEVAPETAEGTDAEDEDVEMKMEDAL